MELLSETAETRALAALARFSEPRASAPSAKAEGASFAVPCKTRQRPYTCDAVTAEGAASAASVRVASRSSAPPPEASVLRVRPRSEI